jgi:hypothetical protein
MSSMSRTFAFAVVLLTGALSGCGCSSSNNKPPVNGSDAGGAGGAAGSSSAGGADGGSASGGSGGGGGSGSGGTGGGGGAGGASTYSGGCPSTAPADGAVCTSDGRSCSYGNAPRGECRPVATCTGGHWSVHAGTCPPPSSAADCPSAPPAEGAACTTDQQLCDYPGAKECMCFVNVGWTCDVPHPTDPTCPTTPPNAGTTCAGTKSCVYMCSGFTSNLVSASCTSGVWVWSVIPCMNHNVSPGN